MYIKDAKTMWEGTFYYPPFFTLYIKHTYKAGRGIGWAAGAYSSEGGGVMVIYIIIKGQEEVHFNKKENKKENKQKER